MFTLGLKITYGTNKGRKYYILIDSDNKKLIDFNDKLLLATKY